MKYGHPILIVLVATGMTACATRPEKTQIPESMPATKPAPVKAAPARESIKKAHAVEVPAIRGPVPDSKFAKLKIGMTLSEVEKLIGAPARKWQHATEKARIPYYFGPDRWVIEYLYKGEGVLTFNSGGEQALTRIDVNPGE